MRPVPSQPALGEFQVGEWSAPYAPLLHGSFGTNPRPISERRFRPSFGPGLTVSQPKRYILGFEVSLQPFVPQLAAHPALLHAAKRTLRRRRYRVVDADDARLQ